MDSVNDRGLFSFQQPSTWDPSRENAVVDADIYEKPKPEGWRQADGERPEQDLATLHQWPDPRRKPYCPSYFENAPLWPPLNPDSLCETKMFADACYRGTLKNEKMNGTGRLEWSDGDVYIGEFKDDKTHGLGRYTSAGGMICEGNFRNGKLHGQATCLYEDKTYYAGPIRNGLRDGTGVLDAVQYRYEGSFRNNVRHGEGIERRAGRWADVAYDNDVLRKRIFMDGFSELEKYLDKP